MFAMLMMIIVTQFPATSAWATKKSQWFSHSEVTVTWMHACTWAWGTCSLRRSRYPPQCISLLRPSRWCKTGIRGSLQSHDVHVYSWLLLLLAMTVTRIYLCDPIRSAQFLSIVWSGRCLLPSQGVGGGWCGDPACAQLSIVATGGRILIIIM